MKISTVAGLFCAGTLAIALSAAAQTGATGATGQTAPTGAKAATGATGQAAPKEHTMTGCLQKGTEAGTFIVTNSDPKGPKTIGIIESKDKLDAHVGHKIDITGTGVSAKEAESAAVKPAKADHYMKVTAIKMVSATCP